MESDSKRGRGKLGWRRGASLFDQGLTQILQIGGHARIGCEPAHDYIETL